MNELNNFSGHLPIYNCCTSKQRFLTMEQIIEMGKAIQDETPLDIMLWRPGGSLTPYRALNYIRFILFQLLPALLIDFLIGFKGHKPM